MSEGPKVLLFDIENSPLITANWGLYEQNAVWTLEEWYILCFSYRWLGKRKTYNKSLLDYRGYKSGRDNEKALVTDLWKLFDEADIIIGHNGDRFDIRKSNAKFLEYGLGVPGNYKTVDTLKIARKYFALTSNKLDYLADILGIGRKKQTGGYKLWEQCMAGDKKAWKKMNAYCNHDVLLLEKVYLELRKWHVSHPDLNIYNGERGKCKTCQSTKLEKRGFDYTKVKKFQRYRCKNCGSWQRGEQIKNKKK